MDHNNHIYIYIRIMLQYFLICSVFYFLTCSQLIYLDLFSRSISCPQPSPVDHKELVGNVNTKSYRNILQHLLIVVTMKVFVASFQYFQVTAQFPFGNKFLQDINDAQNVTPNARVQQVWRWFTHHTQADFTHQHSDVRQEISQNLSPSNLSSG